MNPLRRGGIVALRRKTAKMCETLGYGEEGRTKTKKSNRDIDLLPPTMEALIDRVLPVNMGSREPPYGGLCGSGRLGVADRVGLFCFSADGQVVIPGHVVLGLFEEP
jgi:hypothetical protein